MDVLIFSNYLNFSASKSHSFSMRPPFDHGDLSKGLKGFLQKLHFWNPSVPTKKMRYDKTFLFKFSLNLFLKDFWQGIKLSPKCMLKQSSIKAIKNVACTSSQKNFLVWDLKGVFQKYISVKSRNKGRLKQRSCSRTNPKNKSQPPPFVPTLMNLQSVF